MNKIDHEQYGVSYRQFDYWASKGWIRSGAEAGSGHDRWFPDSEIEIFRIMATLITIGFRPERAAELARANVEHGEYGTLKLFRGGGIGVTGILSDRGNAIPEVDAEAQSG